MSQSSALLKLHFAALLFGSTALFGEYMSASPIMIVFGRTVFAVLALSAVAVLARRAPWHGLSGRDIGRLLFAGVVLTLHWITFFKAVRSGGVALATLGFASFPVFVALLEAAVLRERLKAADVGILLLVTAGMVLITPSFELADSATAGLLWGILSGAIYACIAVFNRYLSTAASGTQSCWWQCLAAALSLAPFGWREAASLPGAEWLLLACLGAVCTGLAYTIFLQALERVKAQTVAIVISMEPVYAIALAWLLFGAAPGLMVLLGGALVIAAVMWSSVRPRHA
ncbi:DMT family transporter [Pseudoduganella namucuonensis]|uniref:Threonine/homoserine efflux transporter RhtA n=1 Tax=Pseudoduganella namucuonensis TaxID=1035707 RepID=A0A1I7M4Y1_9BURK|nr:DMT family transporter [Pseudoduganella namucuonensis]SFV16963.1 Threonine/homoserine efflux transporter RhtA [Pseudoduganella namucuonensis]